MNMYSYHDYFFRKILWEMLTSQTHRTGHLFLVLLRALAVGWLVAMLEPCVESQNVDFVDRSVTRNEYFLMHTLVWKHRPRANS